MLLKPTSSTAKLLPWALLASVGLHGLALFWISSAHGEKEPITQTAKSELQVLINAPVVSQSHPPIQPKLSKSQNSTAKPKINHATKPLPMETTAASKITDTAKVLEEPIADTTSIAHSSETTTHSSPSTNHSVQTLRSPPPPYPRQSRQLEEQGTVILTIYILKTGKVAQVKIQQSSGYPRLDASAQMTVAERWEFSPEIQNGSAVDVWYQLPVTFKLSH